MRPSEKNRIRAMRLSSQKFIRKLWIGLGAGLAVIICGGMVLVANTMEWPAWITDHGYKYRNM